MDTSDSVNELKHFIRFSLDESCVESLSQAQPPGARMMEFSENVSQNQCPICLEPFTSSEPPFAARCGHSMHGICLSSAIRSGFFACPLCRSPFGDVTAETKELQKFGLMLKSGLPEAAVRQLMAVKGVSPSTIDAFFTGGVSRMEGVRSDAHDELPPIDTKIFKKFATMLKAGVCEAAVRQQMAATNFPDTAIDQFFSDYMRDL
jgi:hypothetical protein